jgi:hypothetical protein
VQALSAQSIVVKRTDVDSSRYGFVTASYTFGMDIYLKDLPKSNGVAFQLNFNQSEVIKFSQWLPGDFGKPQVIPMLNPDGTSNLIIAVGLGNNTISDSIAEPKVLHLEFVVLQNASNGSTLNFNFIQPVATTIVDDVREIISINADPIAYSIHGFINVWPGDTDNNGIVNHLDYANVTKFIGLGSATKNMKSFKRRSGSAIWAAHRVLTWDNAEVTYADCDGNGDITITDMLIVSYNMGKDTLNSSVKKDNDILQEDFPKPEVFDSPDYVKIPLNVNPELDFITAVSTFNLSEILKTHEFIGVEVGNTFSEKPFAYYVLDDNHKLHLAVGSYLQEQSQSNSSNLCNLVLRNKTGNTLNVPSVNPNMLRAITNDGYIFDLNFSLSDVNIENHAELFLSVNGNLMEINALSNILSVEIIDIFGQIVKTESVSGYSYSAQLSNLSAGLYLARINYQSGQNFEIRKFIITR